MSPNVLLKTNDITRHPNLLGLQCPYEMRRLWTRTDLLLPPLPRQAGWYIYFSKESRGIQNQRSKGRSSQKEEVEN